MGRLGIGIALVVVGLVLGLLGLFGAGGTIQTIGWVLLAFGIMLAIVQAIVGRSRRRG